MDVETGKALFYKNAKPPEDALKPIDFGKLKGKSDINPQWRVEALTDAFGLCGVGWYYEILSIDYQDVQATGERMVYITVGIHIKDGENWSAPVIGIGGDFTVVKDKNGMHGNDEAFQMALTDALGKAAKCLGVANDIYRGRYDSKYGWRDEQQRRAQESKATQATTKELWRLQGNDILINTKRGWVNLKDMELRWLQVMLTDARYDGIRDFVQARIDEVKKA